MRYQKIEKDRNSIEKLESLENQIKKKNSMQKSRWKDIKTAKVVRLGKIRKGV